MPNPASPRLRTLAAASALLCLGTATAGCAGTSGASERDADVRGRVVLWDGDGGAHRAVWTQIIRAFEKRYPHADVRYVRVPADEAPARYDEALRHGGRGLPDVGLVSTSYLADLVDRHALEEVTQRVDGGEIGSRLVTAVRDGVATAGGDDEQLYAVPLSAEQATVWWRTDLLAEAGLSSPADSWDAFYKAADALADGTGRDGRKDGDGGKDGADAAGGVSATAAHSLALPGAAGGVPQALAAMYAQSGVRSFWHGSETTVNAPENVEALEKYVDLYGDATSDDDAGGAPGRAVAAFDHGEAAMLQQGLGSYRGHVRSLGAARVEGAPLPPSEPGAPRTTVAGPVAALGVFRQTRHEAAAWKFVEFAASHRMSSRWNEATGTVPARTDAGRDPWVRRAKATRAALRMLDGSDETDVVQLPYYLPQWNAITTTESEDGFRELLRGGMSAQDFADDLAARLDDAQARYEGR